MNKQTSRFYEPARCSECRNVTRDPKKGNRCGFKKGSQIGLCGGTVVRRGVRRALVG